MTDLGAVLAQLKAERAKLDKAIKALSGVGGGVNDGCRQQHESESPMLSEPGGRSSKGRSLSNSSFHMGQAISGLALLLESKPGQSNGPFPTLPVR